jgi:predicted KAP-like P-loop ATPase
VHYWRNVFFAGLNQYVQKPRDVVRILNILTVTYPSVAGEVNFGDFFALEFLRLFEPTLYAAIRDNQGYFTGFPERLDERNKAVESDFHEAWVASLPEDRRSAAKSLVPVIFPRLKTIWGNTRYSGDQLVRARKDLRISSPEHFDTYFRFSIPDTRVSRRELREFLRQATSADVATSILLKASQSRIQDGESKAHSYFDELRLVDEFPPGIPENVLDALYAVADQVYPRPWDYALARYYWRLVWLVEHLLGKVDVDLRAGLLARCLVESNAPTFVFYTARLIQEARKDKNTAPDSLLLKFTEVEEQRFLQIMLEKLRTLTAEQLVNLPELRIIVDVWRTIDDSSYVVVRMKELLESDDLLPAVLEQYLLRGSTQSMEDHAAKMVVQLDPESLKDYVDLDATEIRVKKMLDRQDLTDGQREGGVQFLLGLDKLRRGVRPSSIAGVLESIDSTKKTEVR